MSVPKCTSWLGHKFEARYSYSPVAGKYNVEGGSSAHIQAMADKMRQQTYQHDICVRCGHVVPRQPHNGEQGS